MISVRFLLRTASLLLVVGTLSPLHAARPGTVLPPLNDKLVKDVTYLASDDLEGRGLGTKGLDVASEYIADRFRSLELRTLPGQPDYFQEFFVNRGAAVNAASTLKIGQTNLTHPRQFIPQGFSADAQFDAPVVFAGYGISSTDQKYDDYAGIDVKGKVVLVLRYEPHNEQGTSRFVNEDWSPDAALNAKAEAAAKNGAVALLLVNPPRHHDGDTLLGVNRGGGRSEIPFIHIRQEVADDLLRRGGSEKTLGQLQAEIDSTGQPRSFALKDISVSGNVKLDRDRVAARNVMAYLRGGSNPDEYVVVGAHYDHLGRGGSGSLAPMSHEIHNGADDNASGTAALLNLAERLVYAGRRDRSIIFVLFSGEEEGLLGSQHFVQNCPVPLAKIVGMLNLDMVGRVRSNILYTGGSGTAAAFDPMLASADVDSPLELKSIGKGGRGPSDHMSFSLKQIPVLFFFSGVHADYHTPTDDSTAINYAGIVEVIRLSMRVVNEMSRMPKQQYVSTFDSEMVSLNSGTGSRGTRVSLGVVPDYSAAESTTGVRIQGTSPGSPAALAGLKDGDVVVQIADKKIGNLVDLSEYLGRARPGDQVKVVLMRDGQRIEVSLTLAERKG